MCVIIGLELTHVHDNKNIESKKMVVCLLLFALISCVSQKSRCLHGGSNSLRKNEHFTALTTAGNIRADFEEHTPGSLAWQA